ncbi:protein phosphatase 1 regulatory subunit 27 [Hydra vulgaris]|uniref:protein phosphatase 1 regulatory subunit 27 n=1 Tax=Hydra vulgaris TaxID=6087 RepID=UPI0002B4D6EE|nr:protein phosphatase 1 regulatory subunit 27-like [Hydra vulgaris]
MASPNKKTIPTRSQSCNIQSKRRRARRTFSRPDNELFLINAVVRQDVDDAQFILERRDVDVNSMCYLGWAAVHYACKNNQLEMVKLLLQYGANTNLMTNDENFPLKIAVTWGAFDVYCFLLQNGVFYNYTENDLRISYL